MARVHHVMKARKDNPVVKKGEPYYWWKFRYGGKLYSATPPRSSQLTQSEFLGGMYAALEALEDFSLSIEAQKAWESNPHDPSGWKEELASAIDEAAEEIRRLGEECADRRESMPEQLQDAPTGEMLGERAEMTESMADELESTKDEVEAWELEDNVDSDGKLTCDEDSPWDDLFQQAVNAAGYEGE